MTGEPTGTALALAERAKKDEAAEQDEAAIDHSADAGAQPQEQAAADKADSEKKAALAALPQLTMTFFTDLVPFAKECTIYKLSAKEKDNLWKQKRLQLGNNTSALVLSSLKKVSNAELPVGAVALFRAECAGGTSAALGRSPNLSSLFVLCSHSSETARLLQESYKEVFDIESCVFSAWIPDTNNTKDGVPQGGEWKPERKGSAAADTKWNAQVGVRIRLTLLVASAATEPRGICRRWAFQWCLRTRRRGLGAVQH